MNPLNPSGRPAHIVPVAGFDAFLVDEPWPWREEHRAAIDEHWAEAKAAKPALFDGKVLVARRFEIADGIWRAPHIVIPYSALKYWLSRDFVDAGAFNSFASAVVVTADRAVLLGRMAPHTANAGRVYFPCGTPDLDDVEGGRLNLENSLLRELDEETGLGPHVIPTEHRWVGQDGPLICCARRFDTALTALEVEAVIAAHQANDPQPELDRVILVKSPSDLEGQNVMEYARALIDVVLECRNGLPAPA
ncbi:NUDIX hydrolase [Terrihabitans sp. B22-R8]|uniref:NUDIX hydrolase n=1 Tax=Terrihabitans sp. B22-R8 TaxID=3425128 RepID=UPI00403CC977